MATNDISETIETAAVHTHTDEHGNIYTHTHTHTNTHSYAEGGEPRHSHSHSPEHKKKVLNRLSKAIGHLESVKRMVADDRDCGEVLIQLMAVYSAIRNTGKVILREHMSHCLIDAIHEGDYDAIEEFDKSIEMFL